MLVLFAHAGFDDFSVPFSSASAAEVALGVEEQDFPVPEFRKEQTLTHRSLDEGLSCLVRPRRRWRQTVCHVVHECMM